MFLTLNGLLRFFHEECSGCRMKWGIRFPIIRLTFRDVLKIAAALLVLRGTQVGPGVSGDDPVDILQTSVAISTSGKSATGGGTPSEMSVRFFWSGFLFRIPIMSRGRPVCIDATGFDVSHLDNHFVDTFNWEILFIFYLSTSWWKRKQFEFWDLLAFIYGQNEVKIKPLWMKKILFSFYFSIFWRKKRMSNWKVFWIELWDPIRAQKVDPTHRNQNSCQKPWYFNVYLGCDSKKSIIAVIS